MRECYQTPTQNVLEHGESVWAHFVTLLGHIAEGKEVPEWWRLPQWIHTPNLLDKLMPLDVIEEYIVYHDCGKPLVLSIDQDGRRHFPNHAKVSGELWLAAGGNIQSAKLMGMDMDAHLLKGDQVEEFASRPEAVTLLLTAIAEVHSNANLFGGQNSDSFKMKAKHLDKRGRQVLAAMNNRGAE